MFFTLIKQKFLSIKETLTLYVKATIASLPWKK